MDTKRFHLGHKSTEIVDKIAAEEGISIFNKSDPSKHSARREAAAPSTSASGSAFKNFALIKRFIAN